MPVIHVRDTRREIGMSPPGSWLAVDRAADREASLLLAFNFFEHMMGPTVCKPGVCLPAAGSRCGGDA